MSNDLEAAAPVPLVISVDLAGELLNVGRQAAYRLAQEGTIPVLPGPGRRRVPVARLEALVGRRITAEDLKTAEARLAPKREAVCKYQNDYRAARKALANA